MSENNEEKKQSLTSNKWRAVAVAALCLLIAVAVLYALGVGWKQDGTKEAAVSPAAVTAAADVKEAETPAAAKPSADEMLSYWTPESRTRQELTAYMAAVTDESSPDFIPVEDRIAVFDFDGTLFCETDPTYFDYCLLKYRVLEDPEYKDKASAFEKSVAEEIASGTHASDLPTRHGQAVASAFKGMTLAEFSAYVQEFKKQPMPHYEGMNRGDGFYLPMLQIVNYLEANDFTVYVISGTDRLIVRGIFENNVMPLSPARIIGSDESLVSSNNTEGADGLSYEYRPDDSVVLGGDFIIKNLQYNKVAVIAKEIGQQPVLSFGNSSGDYSMAEYTVSNNPHKALAFMLCCDDLDRENGNTKKADSMVEKCADMGWIPVSMKNDWTTIYGDSVKYVK